MPRLARILLFLALMPLGLRAQTDLVIAITQLLQSGALDRQGITWATSSWVPGVGGVPCLFTAATTVTCTHNLKSTSVDVAVYDLSGYLMRPATVARTSTTVVTVTFDGVESGIVVVK